MPLIKSTHGALSSWRPFPVIGSHAQVQDILRLNFTDLGELRSNWQLLANRDTYRYSLIESSLDNYDPRFLEAGYGYYHNWGSDALAFLLVSDETASSVVCCRRIANPNDPDHYISPSKPCGVGKFCPRCAFHDTQAFVKDLEEFCKPNKDYFWITVTDPEIFHFTNIGLTENLFQGIKKKIKRVRQRLLQIQRSDDGAIEGMVFAEEAACIDLIANTWNSHIHLIIQSRKGWEPDIFEFESEGLNCDLQPVASKNEFKNKLRYLKKPLSDTLRRKYHMQFDRSHSEVLYRNAQQGIETLIELFQDNHRCERTGSFRLAALNK